MTPDAPAPGPRAIALWRQIVTALEADIAAGVTPPGARLPTEAQLAARFDVNRHTVRRALDDLSRRGRVRVEQGRGSFVTQDVLDYQVGRRTRFSEWIRKYNKEPSGNDIALREILAEPAVARALDLRPGSRVVVLERVGLADGEPVSLGSHHFPLPRLPGVLLALQQGPTISAALARCGVADYHRVVTRVGARMPTLQEAALLHMQRNRPVLVTESVNADQSGVPVEYGITCYPSPRVQIMFEP